MKEPMMDTDSDDRALTHFVTLARNGKFPGCSSGAHAARLLADTFLQRGLILDSMALDGLIEFMLRAKMAPDTARELIG